MADDVVVRIRPLGGSWETFGVDRARGIWPDNPILSTNDWGNDKASFELRRNPGIAWPDLSAFNEVEIEIGGEVMWTGRVAETPSREGVESVINVQCEGWQYHLDDDVYSKSYVQTDLSAWKDMRTFPGVSLAENNYVAGPGVVVDGGQVALTWPKGQAPNGRAGAYLDAGPGNVFKRVTITYSKSITQTNSAIYLADSAGVLFTSAVTTAIAATTASYTCGGSGSRFLFLYFDRNTTTPTADEFFAVTSLIAYAEVAYESGNASILKADTVIKDALAQATALLSTDQTKIAAGSFSIPDLHFETTPQTPREVINGVNAFHNYLVYVDADKRLVWGTRPTAPAFEVGAFGGSVFEDAAQNSGQDVYNRVLIPGVGPDGYPIMVTRSQTDAAGLIFSTFSTPQPTNPSFAVDTSSWTASGAGVLTRDTVTFNDAPASMRLDNGAGATPALGSAATTVIQGQLIAGRQYRLRFWVRAAGGAGAADIAINFGLTSGYTGILAAATWTQVTLVWTPTTTYLSPLVAITKATAAATGVIHIDGVEILSATPTIVDRQNFVRTKVLPVQAALTTAAANQIGDTWLAAHKTQPLKGSVQVQPTGLREVLSGKKVHPSRLLKAPGQLLRLGHRIDPDTGGLGRDGTIAAVQYDHSTRTASVTLDSERKNFDALLARLSVIQTSRGLK